VPAVWINDVANDRLELTIYVTPAVGMIGDEVQGTVGLRLPGGVPVDGEHRRAERPHLHRSGVHGDYCGAARVHLRRGAQDGHGVIT
jgi:hypothetical protein